MSDSPRMIEICDEVHRLEADGPPLCPACRTAREAWEGRLSTLSDEAQALHMETCTDDTCGFCAWQQGGAGEGGGDGGQ